MFCRLPGRLRGTANGCPLRPAHRACLLQEPKKERERGDRIRAGYTGFREENMKTAIVYYSKHHGNTKKLLDAIAAKNEVTLIDVTEHRSAELSGYDRIGFASGIYYNSFAKQLLSFAQEHLPENKDVFYIFTHGAPKVLFPAAIRRIAEQKHCKELGFYHCTGFDTFGPFRLVGGIAKGHPNEEEINAAAAFYRKL